MKLKVMLDEEAILPTRAHEADAGYDLYAREDGIIYPGNGKSFDTGVHIEIPKGYVGMVKSKSGLNVKYNLTTVGVIDSGYTGSIHVKLYNNSDPLCPQISGYHVHKGDKIAQLVITPIITPKLIIVDSLEETERGGNKFGSSGR